MSKIYEFSLIFMHLNRNLSKVSYAVITVSYGKEYFKVFMNISLFLLLSWRRERKTAWRAMKAIN